MYGLLPFAKKMGGKNSSNKSGQKLLHNAKKFITRAMKTVSKIAIQKTMDATGDLIGNKITSVSRSSKSSQNDNANNEAQAPKKRYKSPKKEKIRNDELSII